MSTKREGEGRERYDSSRREIHRALPRNTTRDSKLNNTKYKSFAYMGMDCINREPVCVTYGGAT